jgi:hypothetical protein
MTGMSDFTETEWKQVLLGPPSAGMIIVTAAKGGTFRETFAMSKAYTEARKQHGASQLLDEIVAAKPETDHTHYKSNEELREAGLGHLRDAIALLEQKATPEEVDDYRGFVMALSERVAAAHREDGVEISPEEQQALGEIQASMAGSSGSAETGGTGETADAGD